MARPLMLFLFLASLWGCAVAFTMTQPPSVSTSVGGTVHISCTRSGGDISSSWNSWYQQKPGSPPILVLYQDTKRPSGILERFSGSIDSSANSATLTITNVQAEDEADYYCAAYGNNRVFGQGTQLTVTGQPAVPPSVSLFPPSQEEIKSKNKATLVCLIDDFYPGVVQVEWQADGSVISSGVETTKPVKQGDKYVASSYLSLSESSWKSHDVFSCKVTHESKTIQKEISRSDCP